MSGNARKIDEIIDQQAVEQQLGFLSTYLTKIKGQIETMPDIGSNYKNATGTEAKKALEELAISQQKVTVSSKQLGDETAKTIQIQKQFAETNLKASAAIATQVSKTMNLTENNKLLSKALNDTKLQLQEGIKTGKLSEEQQQKLGNQVSVLTRLVGQQQKGFSSLTAELRAGERALQSMREAGLQNTKEFRELQLATASTRREFNNFAKEQKILSSEAPAVEALTVATRGIGGAYAAGAGAAALFGDEEGKIEKETRKLLAVMTLLRGITEANAAWQQKTALFTSVSVMWTGLLAKVQGVKTAAVVADTAAVEANIAATSGQVVVTEGAAVALGEEAVAAETAAVATTSFYSAISLGLAAAIAAVIGAIVWLVSAIKDMINAEEDSIKLSGKVADAQKKVADAVKERSEIYKMATEQNRKSLEQELMIAEKSGKSQGEILAIKRKMADYDRQQASEAVKRNEVTVNSLIDTKNKWFDAANKVKFYADKMEELIAKGEKIPSILQAQSDAAEKEASLLKGNFEFQKGLWDTKTKAEDEVKANELETAKLTADEIREYNLTSSKIELEDKIRVNEAIFSNEASSHAQRIAAAKSILSENLSLIEAEKKAKLSDPANSGDPQKVKLIELEAGEARRTAKFESNLKIQAENERAAAIELKAYYDLKNSVLETQRDLDREIIENEASSMMDRIKAKQNEINMDLQIESNRFNQAKSKKGITDLEIQALEAEHTIKMGEIASKGAKEIQKIEDQAYEKQIAAAKKAHDALIKAQQDANELDENARIRDQAKAYTELNESFANGAISAKKFSDAKDELDKRFARDTISNQINEQEKLSKLYDVGSKERMAIAAKGAELQKNYSDLNVKNKTKETDDVKKEIDKGVTYEKEAAAVISSFVDAGFENQKNAIAAIENQQQSAYAGQIERIKASTLSDQQKASQLQILEAQRAAQKADNAKKEKDMDIQKAKFDKEMAMFQIVINTAAAVTKFLMEGNVPEAIAAGVTGAAEFTIAAARPIPKYALGTENHPGGPAIVGEVGSELVQTPDGKSFLTPDGPTLLNLPQGAKVLKHEDTINMAVMNDMMRRQASVLIGSPDVVNELKTMREMQLWQTGQIVKALGKKESVNITVVNNGELNDYIKQQVFE